MDSFFSLSKLFWFFASPDHLLVWLLVLGLFLILIGWRVLGNILVCIDLVLWLALLFLPLGDIALRPLETRFVQPNLNELQPAGIIILGGAELAEESAVWGQPQFNSAAERVMALPVLAHAYPELPIVFTGGSGSVLRPEFKGADAVKAYIDALGLTDRVLLENQSRNTFENATFTRQLLGGVPEGRWLLVTSAFHMPRSVGIFTKQGWEIIPYPVDYYSMTGTGMRVDPKLWQNLRDLQTGLREWIGLAVYYYTGKTDQFFPGED